MTNTVEIGPSQGALSVHTYRSGVAGKVGHDLRIEATRWQGTLTVAPDDLTAAGGRVVVESASLRVKEGTGGAKALSDKDRADIEKTMHTKSLLTDQHPEIVFEATGVTGSAPGTVGVDGQLTLLGVSKPVHLDVTVEAGDDGRLRCAGRGTVTQTEFGIKPYSGFFGALKVRDEVDVRFEIEVPAS